MCQEKINECQRLESQVMELEAQVVALHMNPMDSSSRQLNAVSFILFYFVIIIIGCCVLFFLANISKTDKQMSMIEYWPYMELHFLLLMSVS